MISEIDSQERKKSSDGEILLHNNEDEITKKEEPDLEPVDKKNTCGYCPDRVKIVLGGGTKKKGSPISTKKITRRKKPNRQKYTPPSPPKRSSPIRQKNENDDSKEQIQTPLKNLWDVDIDLAKEEREWEKKRAELTKELYLLDNEILYYPVKFHYDKPKINPKYKDVQPRIYDFLHEHKQIIDEERSDRQIIEKNTLGYKSLNVKSKYALRSTRIRNRYTYVKSKVDHIMDKKYISPSSSSRRRRKRKNERKNRKNNDNDKKSKYFDEIDDDEDGIEERKRKKQQRLEKQKELMIIDLESFIHYSEEEYPQKMKEIRSIFIEVKNQIPSPPISLLKEEEKKDDNNIDDDDDDDRYSEIQYLDLCTDFENIEKTLKNILCLDDNDDDNNNNTSFFDPQEFIKTTKGIIDCLKKLNNEEEEEKNKNTVKSLLKLTQKCELVVNSLKENCSEIENKLVRLLFGCKMMNISDK